MGRCNERAPPGGWGGGAGGGGRPPQGVDPLTPGSEKSEVKPKSSFKSAENRAASSF